jgi:nucleotide-binding universal stress UspA family protein
MDGYIANHVAKLFNANCKIQQVISKGKPADEISGLAEKELVDLIVMGSAKGVVTNEVLRKTTRPVFAVSEKATASPQKMERILVTTDFSEHSRKVMRYAFALKKAFNATLYLLYVIETPKAIEFGIRQGHYVNTLEKMKTWAEAQLANLTPEEFINDPSVIRVVDSGPASDRIADVAFEMGADLTIVGTHEYEGLRRFMAGTTDQLLEKIDGPILTVKL